MNKYKFIIVLLAGFLFVFYSCNNKNNPVVPQEKPYPSGIPDWNSSEYNWIDSSYIQWWEYPRSPKFAISILDCSPDGNNLIVQDLSYKKVYTFNLKNRSFEFNLLGKSIIAEWSGSNKLIIFGFESYNKNEMYCIFNWGRKNYYYIPMPDSFDLYSGAVKWWITDTTFLTALMKPNDKISHIYEFNIYPPYDFKIREDLNYNFVQNKNLRYSVEDDTINKFHTILIIRNEKNELINSYQIHGITFPQSQIVISPDGKYLAFIGNVDLTNTRRYDLFMQNGMDGNLVILKLDESNSVNLIYRLFPDYNNHYHGKFYSQYINIGAWSSDSKYFYHTYYLADSTIQIVKRNIYSGKVEFLTNLKAAL